MQFAYGLVVLHVLFAVVFVGVSAYCLALVVYHTFKCLRCLAVNWLHTFRGRGEVLDDCIGCRVTFLIAAMLL